MHVMAATEMRYRSALGGNSMSAPVSVPVEIESRRAPRVLVVEDDVEIREALCDVLRIAGYDPVEAGNGVEALHAIDEHPPDVILLDVRMPVMDGVEFLRVYEERRLPPVRIVVLTANPRDLPAERDLPLLAKPYDVDRLLRMIEER